MMAKKYCITPSTQKSGKKRAWKNHVQGKKLDDVRFRIAVIRYSQNFFPERAFHSQGRKIDSCSL